MRQYFFYEIQELYMNFYPKGYKSVKKYAKKALKTDLKDFGRMKDAYEQPGCGLWVAETEDGLVVGMVGVRHLQNWHWDPLQSNIEYFSKS